MLLRPWLLRLLSTLSAGASSVAALFSFDALTFDSFQLPSLKSSFKWVRSLSNVSLRPWKMRYTTEHNYLATTTAPAETLWQTVSNLSDLAAWHPLITGTNAPYGQDAKPGLIYRAFGRYIPVSTKVFVERVQPGELLSVRVFLLPGVQERATYRIVSTLCGTCVLYSITLSGWLTPLVWPVVKPQITQVATSLVEAAEQATLQPTVLEERSHRRRYPPPPKNDIF
ncbi:MAG: hypothetical protein AAGL17_03215 [Cyanobacteria bacterium J06576_12]